MCIKLCLVKSPDYEHEYWHMLHLYGFSCVWLRLCVFKLPTRENDFIHIVQL